MVSNIARRAAPLLAGVLALMTTSCDFFFATPFPAMLTMAEKMVDLSEYVPKDNDGCPECLNLHLLGGYLFLAMAPGKLVILDTGLQVLEEYTGNFAGRLAGETPGSYYIGGMSLDKSPPFNPTPQGVYGPSHRAFSDGTDIVAIWSDMGLLHGDDGLGGTWSAPIVPGTWFEDVGADMSSAYLLFEEEGSEQSRVYMVGVSLITGVGPGDLTPMIPFYLPEADRGRMHIISGGVENEGLVIRSRGSYQRYNKFNGAVLDELPGGSFGGDGDRYADAFDPNGGYFYYYDGQSKKIYKCRTWW